MILPSIDLMGGHAVQLVGGKELEIDAGDPRPLAEKFGRVGEIAVVDLDAALGQGDNRAVIEELVQLAPCRVGGGIRDADAAKRWLDAGATKVMLGTAARPDVLSQLPRERVVAALDAVDGEIVVEGWKRRTGQLVEDRIEELVPLAGGFLLTFVEREGRMVGMDHDRVRSLVERANPSRVTVAGGIATAEEVGAIDALGADAQVGMALYTGRLELNDVLASILRSDRDDERWATEVVDDAGQLVGRGLSDRASLGETLNTGAVSLHEEIQPLPGALVLRRVELAPSRDALRFVVGGGTEPAR